MGMSLECNDPSIRMHYLSISSVSRFFLYELIFFFWTRALCVIIVFAACTGKRNRSCPFELFSVFDIMLDCCYMVFLPKFFRKLGLFLGGWNIKEEM